MLRSERTSQSRAATGSSSTRAPHLHFHPLPQVVSTRIGDTTVLMHRERGTYHTLNEVGSRVWELLSAGSSLKLMVHQLLSEYDVSQPQLENDVTQVVETLLRQDLIAPGPRPATAPTTSQANDSTGPRNGQWTGEFRLPSPFQAGLAILAVKVALRVMGFDWTTSWIERRVRHIEVSTTWDLRAVQAAERSVALAGALYPGRARCLEQSLVLYYLLRRQGVAIQYRQGVQAHPFVAHAWLEYGDVLINDVLEHVQLYAPLPSPLP